MYDSIEDSMKDGKFMQFWDIQIERNELEIDDRIFNIYGSSGRKKSFFNLNPRTYIKDYRSYYQVADHPSND